MKLPKCTTADLMELFDVSRQTISNFVDQGMPKVEENTFDLAACVRWLLARKDRERQELIQNLGLEHQETRLKKAQADLKEIELAKEVATLVPVDLVEREWDRLYSVTKTHLLSLPSKIAVQVRAAKDIPETKSIMEEEIRQALYELSSTKGNPGSPKHTKADKKAAPVLGAPGETAVKAHSKPVGRRKKVHPA